jgi:periplasmic protein CpxP/Spy
MTSASIRTAAIRRSWASPTRLMWVTLAVATAGLLSLPAEARPGGHMHRGEAHGESLHAARSGPGADHAMLGRGLMSERMLNDIKATPEQRAQLKQIVETARKDLRSMRESGKGQHDEMARLLAQPNVDAQALEALRQKRLAQHDQASRRMTQAMLEASRVLTPQQRQQLLERQQQRRDLMQRHRQEREALDKRSS